LILYKQFLKQYIFVDFLILNRQHLRNSFTNKNNSEELGIGDRMDEKDNID